MNPGQLKSLMRQMDFHPSRKLGQNFLTDDHVLEDIVALSEPRENAYVVEVGPGFGALTAHLLRAKVKLTAIEFDHRLADYLRKNYAAFPNFELIESDAVKVPYAERFATEPFDVTANLPYSISSVLLMTLAQLNNPPKRLTIMLQKEVGDRICAAPSTKAYGALSVCLQSCYTCSIVKDLPPQLFYPAPEIDSVVVRMILRDDAPRGDERQQLFRVIKTAFSQRRKIMAKLLGCYVPRPLVDQALAALEIRPDARAEMLTYAQFRALQKLLPPLPVQALSKKSKAAPDASDETVEDSSL